MKNTLKICLASALTAVLLSGCGNSFVPPQTYGTIKPADDLYIENHYEGTAPTDEPVLETVSSSNGLCVIQKKNSYYDVTLDLEHGTHRDVGKAYAEAILKAYPDYANIMEPYLYENITNAFSELHEDYSGVQKRIQTLTAALDPDHREELEGFAEEISGGETGFRADNRISYDEAMLVSLVPDALRPTNCSAVSLNGSRTASGKRLNARILEWDLGSGRELCTAQCVVRYQNGEQSFTSVSILGMLSVLTAVNRDGLMVGEFDVGSSSRDAYVCDGRKSYSFDLRHCIEQFGSAREAGEYLVKQSGRYTFCVNVMLTDPEEALCAELICTDEKDGHSLLRDGKTQLNDGVSWDDPETMCIVNSYAADGNFDGITGNTNNIIRWEKYRRLFCGCENMTVGGFKERMTCEKQGTDQTVTNFRSSGVVHMVIADYADCSLQAVFAGMDESVDTPEFIALGSWKEGS